MAISPRTYLFPAILVVLAFAAFLTLESTPSYADHLRDRIKGVVNHDNDHSRSHDSAKAHRPESPLGVNDSPLQPTAEDNWKPVRPFPKKEHFEPYSEPAKGVYPEDEHGNGQLGRHFQVHPPKEPPHPGFAGCEYPIVIHSTPSDYCTGALVLYASLVRNVLLQPDHLKDKTCVHITYVEEKLKTLQEMYLWKPVANPFKHITECGMIDDMEEYNEVIPVRWQAIPAFETPDFMKTDRHEWIAAMNKIYTWAFDVYPRILILDSDSAVISDLDLMFDEIPSHYTVAGANDQSQGCHDRSRINGGMILLRPSRYFQIVATELIYDKGASCYGGNTWSQSEQELLNCICGYGHGGHPHDALRPEFACTIMPLYDSVWPQNTGCQDAVIAPTRSLHYVAGSSKPWGYSDEVLDSRLDLQFWKCLRDAVMTKKRKAVAECKIDWTELISVDRMPP